MKDLNVGCNTFFIKIRIIGSIKINNEFYFMKLFSTIKLTPLLLFIIIALESSPWFVFGIFSPMI